jgi:putative flippase GtrA
MINKEFIKKIKQLIKFCIVGLSNNIIFIIFYYILLHFKVYYLISNIISYILSSFCGYILNKTWVFNVNKRKLTKSLIKYYITYGTSFLINICLMYIIVDLLKMSKNIAPFIILCITIPYNFVLSKVWVYK